MKQRRLSLFISLAVVALAMLPLVAEPQQPGKMWRLGFLGVASPARFERGVEAVQLGLRDHGYVEGRNITIEFRWAEDRYDRLPELAAELVRLNPDVIITYGTPGTLALKRATGTIPIVVSIIGNPVENGVVTSLARPGGNITGSSFFSDEVTAKRLEILKGAFPALGRVCVLGNPQNIAMLGGKRTMDSMAQALNVQVDHLEVRRPDAIDAALAAAKAQCHGVVLSDEQVITVGDSPRRIADFALRSRLPSIGPVTYAQAGGMMGYGVDWPDLVRRSMTFVDKILKGAKPADLPIQQATKFELVVNLKIARALDVTIPPSALLRADRVIE
jgi:putative ABC transport system substrate-binding protein